MRAGSFGAPACTEAGPGLPAQVREANFPEARSCSMMLRMKLVTWVGWEDAGLAGPGVLDMGEMIGGLKQAGFYRTAEARWRRCDGRLARTDLEDHE
jgi:hypothetical protein